MKKNPSLIGLLIVGAITVAIVLIYTFVLSKKEGYIIDNPSDTSLNIRINKKEYTIAPQQHIRISLTTGNTQINYQHAGKTVDTVVKINRVTGLINPIRNTYYTFTRPYGYRENKDSIFTSQNISIDNKVYLGMIEQSNQLYIENFYYNLDQDYPKVFLKSDKEKMTDLSKIFNKDDFKQFYFENYE